MTPPVQATIEAANAAASAYAPVAIAAVLAAEQSRASGMAKQQAVVNAILAGARMGESVPNANVAGVAALVDLIVSVLNATGVFSHRAPVAAATGLFSPRPPVTA
jgi:hypothetical protein